MLATRASRSCRRRNSGAVAARHHPIEQHHARLLMRAQPLERLDPVRGRRHFVTETPERELEDLAHVAVVIDNQHVGH
jgi:hypothetical protein